MLATAAPSRRGFNSRATYVSNALDLECLDFNFNALQDIQAPQYNCGRRSDARPAGSWNKRARPNSPYPFSTNTIWNATRENQNRLRTPSLNSYENNLGFPLNFTVQRDANQEIVCNSPLDNPVLNVHVDYLSGGMSGSTSGVQPSKLGSRAGKGLFSDPPGLPEESTSTTPSISKSGRIVPEFSSRRQRVPGENEPRLASTWRQTTSSRGADNPLRAGVREKSTHTDRSRTEDSTRKPKGADRRIHYDLEPFTSFFEPGSEAIITGEQAAEATDYSFWHEPFENSSTVMGMRRLDSGDLMATHSDNSVHPWAISMHGPDPSRREQSLFPTNFPDWTSNMLDITNRPPDSSLEAYDFSRLGDTNLMQMPDTRGANQNTLEFPGNSFESNVRRFERFRGSIYPDELHIDDDITLSLPESTQLDDNESDYLVQTTTHSDHMNISDENDRYLGLITRSELDFTPQIHNQIPLNLEFASHARNTLSNSLFTSLPLLRAQSDQGRLQVNTWPNALSTGLAFGRSGKSPSLLSSSAEFSSELGFFTSVDQDYQTNTALNVDERSLLANFADEVSVREGSIENNSSGCTGSSENSDDISRGTQTLREFPPRKRHLSSSQINENYSSLQGSAGRDAPFLELFEDTNATQPEVQELLAKANRQPSRVRTSSNSPPRKIATTWQHRFLVQSKPGDTTREFQLGHISLKARRKGPLHPDVAYSARRMRKIGSCLPCRVSKIKCTPGEICEPCLKGVHSPLNNRFICRSHLRDYASLFRPNQTVRVFQPEAISQVLEKIGFSDNMMDIFVVSGPEYQPIRLTVREFRPQDPSILVFKKIMTDEITNISSFTKTYSLPLGIADADQDLKNKLTRHIQKISQGKRSHREVLQGPTSQLAWEMYDAIRLYQQSKPNSVFLRNILMLYSMQYFMTKSITILEESSTEALRNIRRPTEFEYTYTANLRLINMQVKHQMYEIISRAYTTVLEELETELRPKDRNLWTTAFCGIMILNMCAEMVQITTDLRVVNALDDAVKTGLDKNGNKPSRDDSILVFRQLDDLPIEAAINMFHLVHRTAKIKDRFNPICDELDAETRVELGQDVHNFISCVKAIVQKYQGKLESQAAPHTFKDSPNPVDDHAIFRKHNSGRLVAKFLLSFL